MSVEFTVYGCILLLTFDSPEAFIVELMNIFVYWFGAITTTYVKVIVRAVWQASQAIHYVCVHLTLLLSCMYIHGLFERLFQH